MSVCRLAWKNGLFAVLVASLLACAPESPDVLLAKAEQAMEDGDPRAALIHLRNVLERNPDNTEAMVRLGKLYSFAGDARTAERFFRAAARRGADPAVFRGDWLSAQLQVGRYEELLEATDPLPEDLDQATALGMRGYAFQGLGRLVDAEATFNQAVEENPDSPNGYTDLAQLLLLLNRSDLADQNIELALNRDEDYAPALILLGTRQFAAGEMSQAKTTLARAAELAEQGYSPSVWISALAGLAEIQLFAGETEAAALSIDQAGNVVGESVEVRYLRAQLAAQKGELDDARSLLQSILGDLGEHAPSQRLLGSIYALEGTLNLAELYLKMAVNSDARDSVARGLLAAVRMQQDKPDEAIDLLGDESQLLTAGQSGFLALAGQANLQAGNVDRALEIFGAGAEQFPDDWRFALGQALSYLRALRTDEAILLLESLDEREAPEVRGTTLVLSYVQKGDFDKADSEARSLAQRYPQEPWAQNLLASWLMQQQKFTEAALAYARSYALEAGPEPAAGAAEARVRGAISKPTEFLEDWLARNPDDLPTRHALAQITLAMGDYQRSGELYEGIIKEDTQHVGALNNLAWIYLQSNDERAVDVGRRAYKLARRNAAVADTYGWAEVQLGELARGLQSLEQAVELEPEDPDMQFHLAVARARSGDTDRAREQLTLLVESGLEFENLEAAREELQRL
jgi:putative PEP-CTERM system TPR-repeat lipoprotein